MIVLTRPSPLWSSTFRPLRSLRLWPGPDDGLLARYTTLHTGVFLTL